MTETTATSSWAAHGTRSARPLATYAKRRRAQATTAKAQLISGVKPRTPAAFLRSEPITRLTTLVELLGRYSKLPAPVVPGCPTRGRPDSVVPPRVHSIARRLDEATIAAMVADYEAGVPTTKLTAKYSLGKGTVLRLLRGTGTVIRRQPLSSDEVGKIESLYGQGWSCQRIGELIGRDHSLVWLTLKRAEVPRRDSHGREQKASWPSLY